MEIFASMAAAREHYGRRGFTLQQSYSDGRVMLRHPAGRSRVHLTLGADGRVRALRLLSGAQRGALRVHRPTTARGGLWPLRLLVALPFIATFAVYGVLLALFLVGWDHLPGIQRSA